MDYPFADYFLLLCLILQSSNALIDAKDHEKFAFELQNYQLKSANEIANLVVVRFVTNGIYYFS